MVVRHDQPLIGPEVPRLGARHAEYPLELGRRAQHTVLVDGEHAHTARFLSALEFLRRVLQPFGGEPLLRAVAQYLDEPRRCAAFVAQHRCLAAGPEPLAALAQVPAFVGRGARFQRGPPFVLGPPRGDIVGREDAIGGALQHLRLRPAEHTARALAPARHVPVKVGRDHRMVGGAVDDLAVAPPGRAAEHPVRGVIDDHQQRSGLTASVDDA